MTIMQVVNQCSENGVQLVRVRKIEHEKGTPWLYDCKPAFTGKKKGWFYFDTFTASAFSSVYNALNDQNKIKFEALPLNVLVNFVWKSIR